MIKTSTALKFTDDTKVFIWSKSDGDRHSLQNDLNKSNGLRNDKWCSILGNISASTLDMGTKTYNMHWLDCTKYYRLRCISKCTKESTTEGY